MSKGYPEFTLFINVKSLTPRTDSLLSQGFFQKNIRSHWTIENKLHWVLGIAFSEDAFRKCTGNVEQNFAILSKIALNVI